MSQDNTPTPLREEQLHEIRERIDRAWRAALVQPDPDWPVPMMALWYSNDGNALLAEVERLRTIVQPGDHPLLRNMRDDDGESWHSDYDDFVAGMTPASARYVYDLLRTRMESDGVYTMNEQELQQIRDSRNTLALHPTGRMLVSRYVRHIDALVAEIERLRADVAYWRDETAKVNEHRAAVIIERDTAWAREAAMRELVQVVADSDPETSLDHGLTITCRYCHIRREWPDVGEPVIAHADGCLWVKARAILAAESEGNNGE